MSKIVHPYAHRLVTLRDWKSRWFATTKNFKGLLRGDTIIREYLEKSLKGKYVSSIEIERSQKVYRIIIRTSRPGVIIGRSGEGSIKLRQEVMALIRREKLVLPQELKIDILEVQNPDADAQLVAASIAEALEKRMTFRRVMKQTIERVMGARGVKGVRIVLGGRLGGAEISRSEELKRGSIPLQTIRADVDYAKERGNLPYGVIGIKVWIYKGEIFDKDKK
jgi:small subunit ribosomal protein S3